MSDVLFEKDKYDINLLSHIKETNELIKSQSINFIAKKNGQNHYDDRKMSLEIGKIPDLKLSEDGVLSFLDTVGRRAGISLNLFEEINGIKLDNWRKQSDK